MRREIDKYFYDVLTACDAIRQFTMDKTLKDYQSNLMLRSAVERQLMIIGDGAQSGRASPAGFIGANKRSS
jgi:uncharacterized protein with HEPN domain